MGSPTSSILSEVYIQHMEGTAIPMILSKHSIKEYYRYVDDMLIVYIDNNTNIHSVQHTHGTRWVQQHNPKTGIHSRRRTGWQNLFPWLHHNEDPQRTILRYVQEHTTPDLIIPKDSCHPFEQNNSSHSILPRNSIILQTIPRVQRERKRDHKTNSGQQQIWPKPWHCGTQTKEKYRTSTHIHKRKKEQVSRMLGRKPVTSLKFIKTRT